MQHEILSSLPLLWTISLFVIKYFLNFVDSKMYIMKKNRLKWRLEERLTIDELYKDGQLLFHKKIR